MKTSTGFPSFILDFGGSARIAKTPLASDTGKLLEEALIFNHRPDVQRVIFISTPHRGSDLASNWIGRIGAALVRTPRLFTSGTLQANRS